MTFRHWSRVTPYTSPCGLAECCVFAKQSPGPLHQGSHAHGKASPPHPRERLFSRSYEARLPSSLTWFLPRTSVSSTSPPVSVCGTDCGASTLRRFSRRHGADPFPPGGPGGPRRGSGRCARHLTRARPARLDRLIQQPADPSFRFPPSLRAAGPGILTWRSIGRAFRPRLRFRLTLGGRTWPRNPWTFGGADSHRPFRYSCLHGHSHAVHRDFHPGFSPHATLSYRPLAGSRGFGCALQSRSFSARRHSSSELLRTLQMMAASEPTSWMSTRRHILTIH